MQVWGWKLRPSSSLRIGCHQKGEGVPYKKRRSCSSLELGSMETVQKGVEGRTEMEKAPQFMTIIPWLLWVDFFVET